MMFKDDDLQILIFTEQQKNSQSTIMNKSKAMLNNLNAVPLAQRAGIKDNSND